jgi:hypothetical protein
MMSLRARVTGIGLWMPGFPDPASWLAGHPVAGTDLPNAAAQAKLRRRSSLLVNMVIDVASQASQHAGVPLSRLRVVVGSAYGELATLVAMLDERERDGVLSPLRFQNSVHNAAAGQLSIVHGNKAPATSLAAGNDTVAMVLLEAMTLLALGGDEVIAIVADEPLPQSIRPGHHASAIAAALVLAPDTGGAGEAPPTGLGVLEDLRQTGAAPPAAERPLEVDGPSAAILPLIAALGRGRTGRVDVSPAEDPRWTIALSAARGIGAARAQGES